MSNLLYNGEDIDNTIIECIDSILDGKEYPLTESIEFCPRLFEYSVLIESAEEISNIKKNINDIKLEKDPEKINNIFTKMINSMRNVFNWWYKIDPDKKYKTLHTVLKILVSVLGIILVILSPGKSIIAKKIATKLPIGYEGINGVLKFFFSKTLTLFA